MNPSDPQGDLLQGSPPAASPSPLAELQAQCQSLRSMLVATLIASILLSFGVIIFMLKQMTHVSAQLEATRPDTRTLMTDFRSKSEPLMRNFVGSLQVFAATNRDFMPVLEKYRTALFPYFTAATPSASGPQPTQPPPPKTIPK